MRIKTTYTDEDVMVLHSISFSALIAATAVCTIAKIMGII